MQNHDNKKHVIVDYKNVTSEILTLFTQKYPYGYEEEDIIKFNYPNGKTVAAVPMETEDTEYLIKVSLEMDRRIDAFLEDEDDVKTERVIEAPDPTAMEE